MKSFSLITAVLFLVFSNLSHAEDECISLSTEQIALDSVPVQRGEGFDPLLAISMLSGITAAGNPEVIAFLLRQTRGSFRQS